jgi:hypothetical protein
MHERAGFDSAEEGVQSRAEIRGSSDCKPSSHTYMDMDTKEDIGYKAEAESDGRCGLHPLRLDRNVSDFIEEQERVGTLQ